MQAFQSNVFYPVDTDADGLSRTWVEKGPRGVLFQPEKTRLIHLFLFLFLLVHKTFFLKNLSYVNRTQL